ncbi:class I SAM-dependent methyltransferase, partial [Patescibacteria group bacterium]|nr:class I SAM-dependent methyltransferase [Patescibacteria group bacterium]
RTNLDDWATNLDTPNAEKLGALFKSYGSDKSGKHDYYRLYAHLLKDKRELPISIFEIGLGTNNMDVPSNMGKYGKPGASLRAFRDWAPHANVHGADVDDRVLFEEERIKTYYLDQTKPDTLHTIAQNFTPNSFDLVIDDGLHNSWANLNTLEWALGLIKDDGHFVIEDVVEKYIDTFDVAAALLKDHYDCELVKCRTEWIFLARKK